jgi:hypothetical protein
MAPTKVDGDGVGTTDILDQRVRIRPVCLEA